MAEAAQDTVRHSPVWYAVVEGAIADAPTLPTLKDEQPKTTQKKRKKHHRKHHHRRATAKPKGAHHRRRKTNVSAGGDMPFTMKKRGKRKRQTIARSRTRRQSTERLVSMMQVAKLREQAGLGGVGGAEQTTNAKLKRVQTFRVAEPLAHSKSPAQMLQMTAAAAAAAPGSGSRRRRSSLPAVHADRNQAPLPRESRRASVASVASVASAASGSGAAPVAVDASFAAALADLRASQRSSKGKKKKKKNGKHSSHHHRHRKKHSKHSKHRHHSTRRHNKRKRKTNNTAEGALRGLPRSEREALILFYGLVAPAKIASVDEILGRFVGDPDKMWKILAKFYPDAEIVRPPPHLRGPQAAPVDSDDGYDSDDVDPDDKKASWQVDDVYDGFTRTLR